MVSITFASVSLVLAGLVEQVAVVLVSKQFTTLQALVLLQLL
jgi:hypothetical protein